ncbi:WSC domain-containing protein [Xylariomycetidae sp. FL2044]|nr:WSC domain-containing protein [Xylariomycetidae sp. FL2044]
MMRLKPGWRSMTVALAYLLAPHVSGLASTDTITWGGGNSRTGYEPNHNMDPGVVGSAQFGQIFRTKFPGNYNGLGAEQVFSQPLVYTLSRTGKQYVYVLTTQNNLYQIDAKSGAIVNSRSLHIPFLTSDLDGCVDINPTVGVTGTGVIDPNTETLYFTSKTYQAGYTSGRLNGEYWFHAVDVNTLEERAGFPKTIEGLIFRNNPNRMFQSGNTHQRPGLLQVGQYIYAGFASHCVQYNFTGAIIGWNKDTGAIVEAWAMEGGPEPNTIKGGGVWMSGGGLSYDSGSIFFATGNGYASQLSNVPVPGRQPPSSLEEAAVNAKVNDDGTLTPIDFFMPWEKQQLDGADKDLGTSPLVILPSSTFSCPNVRRIGVVTGKSGKTYWLNLDNLGGYQNGPNQLDAVPQQFLNENSVYAGAGVLPTDGGYIYINVIRYQTHVWKFGCDDNGNLAFSHVADTAESNANILGVGHGTTTSLNGQEGTGLLWTSDVEGLNLRIYNAVPNAQGTLTMINSFNVPGSMKFGRPVFGDGICYVASNQGYLYAFGSPVNLPLNCTAPPNFGSVVVNGTSAYQTITCTATVRTRVTSIGLIGNLNFNFNNLPSFPVDLKAGDTFAFQAAFTPKQVGPLSSSAQVNTTTSTTGYAGSTPVKLVGTGDSVSPLLRIAPNTVSFTGIITGQYPDGTNQTALLANLGSGTLHISNFRFSTQGETGPWITPNVTGSATSVGPFTFYQLPTTIPGKSTAYVAVNFNPPTSGNFAVFLNVVSDGGSGVLDVLGSSGTNPEVLIQFQSVDGSNWVNYTSNTPPFTFGNVTQGSTVIRKLRLTNVGGPNAAALSITVSKPPYGVPGIIGAANNVDLAEGISLAAGQSATADLFCSVPRSQVNIDSYNGTAVWTLNTGDPNEGKQFIQFFCNAVADQVGPLASNGSAIYRYTGCAIDQNPGRQLQTRLYVDGTSNTNGKCIAACANSNFAIAGTEYQSECWCGKTMPSQFTTDGDCSYTCSGNINQTCGGNGQQHQGGSFMSVFVASGANTGAPSGPAAPQTIGNYSYQGCYYDNNPGRALGGKVIATDTLTLESCAAACFQYSYFGAEYGRECFCGNTLGTGSTPTTNQADCSMTCAANSSQICGSGNRLTLYRLNQTLPGGPSSSISSSSTALSTGSSTSSPVISSSTTTTTSTTPTQTAPSTVPTSGNYVFLGCRTEATNQRALSQAAVANNSITVDVCAAFCSGYTFMGVEYAQECYCGNSINPGSVPAPGTDCNFPCVGNALQYCGAGNRLNMYSYSSQQPSTTTFSSTSAPTSTRLSTTSSSTSTRLSTTSASTSTTLSTTSASSSTVLPTRTVPSTSSLSSATTSSPAVSTTSSTLKPSTTTTSISTSTSSTPVRPTISGYTYQGCYSEATNGRALNMRSFAYDGMTLQSCAANCSAYAFWGTEYSRECYCGAALNPSSTLLVPPGSPGGGPPPCNMACSGNSSQTCGDGSRLSVYFSPNTSLVHGSPSTRAGNANYTFYSCVAEPPGQRALAAGMFVSPSMTVEQCLAWALQNQYRYAGLEYAKECWGGNAIAASAKNQSVSRCNMYCAGDQTAYCGAGDLLTMYVANGTTTTSSSSSEG